MKAYIACPKCGLIRSVDTEDTFLEEVKCGNCGEVYEPQKCLAPQVSETRNKVECPECGEKLTPNETECANDIMSCPNCKDYFRVGRNWLQA